MKKPEITNSSVRGKAALTLFLFFLPSVALPQAAQAPAAQASQASQTSQVSSYSQFIDPARGLTPDDVIRRALQLNGDLQAARIATNAGRAMVRQAGLKANPMLEGGRTQGINTTDNTMMIGAELPLELHGRRNARVAVAQRELEMQTLDIGELERKLAAEIRMKYGEAIAAARNLKFAEDMLAFTRESQRLVRDSVSQGRAAPLELNLFSVEVSRVEAMKIGFESRVEVAFLALKQTAGMRPEDDLKLLGEFILPEPGPREAAVLLALERRPDLVAMRAAEALAMAQVSQARVEGRSDASIMASYERMRAGFDVMGLNSAGAPAPVEGVFHNIKVQFKLMLPVRNNNNGAVDAAMVQLEAARRRREFAESVARSEVLSAYARFEKAKAAFAIFRDGVREQAIRNLDVIRQTYVLGQRTASDYVMEQRGLVEVESSYTEVLKEYFDAVVEIQRVTGQAVAPLNAGGL